ncbi:MAG: NADH:ubiquinone oxidoreductase [Thermoplasmata archaeon]|nr:NADH:ubiquinone oxidoreductase [Thermoplasmata archaeon]
MTFYNHLIEQAPAMVVAIPLLFAFATPLLFKFSAKFGKFWALLGVFATTVLMYVLAWDVLSEGGDVVNTYIFGAENTQLPLPGDNVVRISFAVDGMSAFMGLIMVTVSLAAIIYSISFVKKYTGNAKFFALMLLVLAANIGMVFTGDLFNLFVWFEVSSIALCGLTVFRSERGEAFEGAAKYLIYSTIAGLILLFSVGLLYGQYGHLNIKFLSEAIGGNAELLMVDKVALGLMMTVFALKAGAVPMHMATPDAYSEAPAPVTAIFVTASQAGLYAMFRMVFTLYGSNIHLTIDLLHAAGWIVIILGVVSMFVGVTMALVQKDIKRLMAYHAISQTGYMLLGVGVGMAVYATGGFDEFGRTAMTGGIFHIFNHAMYKGLLFLTAGAIIYKAGTRDLNKMGGLGRDMKLTALFFIIGALAISGIPPMNGFASKFLIYESVFKFNPIIGAIAMLVSLLTLASFVKVFYSAFMGPRMKEMARGEVPAPMLMGMAVLAGIILVFSMAPSLVVRSLVDPAVNALTGDGGTTSTSLTLFTGHGAWNAVVFMGAMISATIIAVMIRSFFGKKGMTPREEGKKPYLFGNPTEIDGRPIVVPGSNLYWGFTKALDRYYKPVEKFHSGIINEYVFWFVSTLVLVLLVMLAWVR